MVPGLIELVQQEQRKDLLKELERERLIRAAELPGPGLWAAVRQLTNRFKNQPRDLKPQPALVTPGADCNQKLGCCTA